MYEIKCPNCGEVFQASEDGYAKLLKQVRDEEFENELQQRLAQAQQLAQAQRQADHAQEQQGRAQLEARIQQLQDQLAAQAQQAQAQQEARDGAVAQALAQEQVASIYAATNGYLDDVPVEKVRDFEDAFLSFMRDTKKDILDTIRDKKVLTDELKASMNSAIEQFKQGYKA